MNVRAEQLDSRILHVTTTTVRPGHLISSTANAIGKSGPPGCLMIFAVLLYLIIEYWWVILIILLVIGLVILLTKSSKKTPEKDTEKTDEYVQFTKKPSHKKRKEKAITPKEKYTPIIPKKKYTYKSYKNDTKFDFWNLDDEVRELMLSEINSDIENNRFFISRRLNQKGKDVFADYLIRSVEDGDEKTFEEMLDIDYYFEEYEFRNNDLVSMPSNASKLLCQTVFNRYYIRAVCLKAIQDGIEDVEIYRARESSNKRYESEMRIGDLVNAEELLEDLRNFGTPTLIPEINSGLSVTI